MGTARLFLVAVDSGLGQGPYKGTGQPWLSVTQE